MNKKFRKTMLKKYGVDNPSKLKSVQEKKKKNNFRKYGVESTNQLKSVTKKKLDTVKKNCGDLGYAHPSIAEKRRKTSLERYGTEFPMQCEDIIKKRKPRKNKPKFDSRESLFDKLK